ncbi:MAG: hypothetical protein ACPLXC_01310 [Candidatus Pacearchaeota archaeon]
MKKGLQALVSSCIFFSLLFSESPSFLLSSKRKTLDKKVVAEEINSFQLAQAGRYGEEDTESWNKDWYFIEDSPLLVKTNRIYVDSMVIDQYLTRYFLVVDVSFGTLEKTIMIDPAKDFFIKATNRERPMFVGDYEARDVNGNFKKGMYEKLNPGKLKPKMGDYYSFPIDEVIVGTIPHQVVSRKIPFAIGENSVANIVYEDGNEKIIRKIGLYLKGPLYFCSIPLTHTDNLGLKEGRYLVNPPEKKNEVYYIMFDYSPMYEKPNLESRIIMRLVPGDTVIHKKRVENPEEEGPRGGMMIYDYIKEKRTGAEGYVPRAGDGAQPFSPTGKYGE